MTIQFNQIGLTLWTLRQHVRTLPDLERTLERVAAIGYQNVQISAVPPTLIEPEALAQLCAEKGLRFGAGNLDIPGILNAASAAGTEWVIVEQDTCPGDPFDSIATSFEYLKRLLAPKLV